jgi:hypothetical protein
MGKMDRVDVKYDDVKLFGNITKETPQSVTIDVQYPEDFAGIIKIPSTDIDAIMHGVYVPTKYRTKKAKNVKSKRKTKKS